MTDDQMDEIEALAMKADVAPWDGGSIGNIVRNMKQTDAAFIVGASPDRILSLIARAREAEADAERFRWLLYGDFSGNSYSERMDEGRWGHSITWSGYSTRANIRAAIDDAMKGEKA